MILEKTDVLKYCPNYDSIVNSNILDEFSLLLINDYQDFIFNKTNKNDFIELVSEYDELLYKYINNLDFRKFVLEESSKNKTTFIDDLRSFLIEKNQQFEKKCLSSIKPSKWL